MSKDIIVLVQTTDGFCNRIVGYKKVKTVEEAEDFIEKAKISEVNVIKMPCIYSVLNLNKIEEIKDD